MLEKEIDHFVECILEEKKVKDIYRFVIKVFRPLVEKIRSKDF